MTKPEKLSPEAIKESEDKVVKLAEVLNEFERATLYLYLAGNGMDLQRAFRLRVKAGAVN